MPLSELHKKKAKKNYMVLAIIFALVALFFAITLIKMGVNTNNDTEAKDSSEHTINCYAGNIKVNVMGENPCMQTDMSINQKLS